MGDAGDGVLRVGTDDGTAVGRGRESNSTPGLSARGRVWEMRVTGCGVSAQVAEWQSGGRGERGGKRFANAGRSAVAAGWILGTGEVIDTVIDRKIDFIDAY